VGHARDYAFFATNRVLLRESGEYHLTMVSFLWSNMLKGKQNQLILDRYVKTNILSKEAFAHVAAVGVEFAEATDAGDCLLRILSYRTINGRSFFICPRKWAPRGYMDLDLEDYTGNSLLQEIQADQVKSAPVELGLFTSV
jgi:hypothetical protein